MKIAVLSFYSGYVNRGVETFVHELSSQLADRHQLTVFQAGPKPIKAVYPIIRIPLKLYLPSAQSKSLASYFFLNRSSLQIKHFTHQVLHRLRQDPPDILFPLNNGWMSLLGKLFCASKRTKLVLAGFSGIGWDDKLNLWLKPDTFICSTQHQASWAKSINPRAKLAIIPIGVNTHRFQPAGKKFPLKLKPPIVLCVAGPQPYKRVDLAIKAVSRLQNVSLLVVGQQRPAVNRLGHRLLGSAYQNIKVNYQDLDPVYRAADLFTLPSESSEAYGISILEALATNLPVVVNQDKIRQELIDKAGILVDPTDISAYAQAIRTGLTQDFASRPRQQALKFSWEKVAQQYEKLWQDLIA